MSKPKKKVPVSREEQRPEPVWGNFPLVQLAVLAGLILLVVGFFSNNKTMTVIGLGLGCLGGLELSIREHFTGFRSHTTLLAAVAFGLSMGITAIVFKLDLGICLGISAAIAGLSAWLLLKLFRYVSGGQNYRLR